MPSESADDVVMVMDSFKSKIISLKVSKKSGMEREELLADEGDSDDDQTGGGGIWNSISRYARVIYPHNGF